MAKIKERKFYKKICKNCKEPFTAYRPHALYCSTACRAEYWRKTHPYLPAEELRQIKERLGISE